MGVQCAHCSCAYTNSPELESLMYPQNYTWALEQEAGAYPTPWAPFLAEFF